MSDDNDDNAPAYSRSLFQTLARKFMYLLGICFLLWVVVLKNFPNVMSPGSGKPAIDSNARAEMLRKRQEAEAAKQNPDAPPTPAVAADTAEVIQLRQRIEVLEARMKQYEEKQPAAAATEPAAIAPQGMNEADKQHVSQLEEQLEKQQGVLATLQAQLGEQGSGTRERTAQLEEQLTRQREVIQTLKTQLEELQANGARKLTAFTAFGFMKEAILRGEPFATQLRHVDEQTQDAKIKSFLMQLAPFSTKGVITLPVLQGEFTLALDRALASANKGNSLSQNLQSLIRIRKVGEQQRGSDDESILARAEAKLGRGEVSACLMEVATLSPTASDAFAAWMKQAEAFVLVRNHLDTLQLAIVQDKDVIPEAAAPAPKPKAAEPEPEVVVKPAPAPETSLPESPQESPAESPQESPLATSDSNGE